MFVCESDHQTMHLLITISLLITTSDKWDPPLSAKFPCSVQISVHAKLCAMFCANIYQKLFANLCALLSAKLCAKISCSNLFRKPSKPSAEMFPLGN